MEMGQNGGLSMERLARNAIDIINELHTERLDYNSEYLPLINAANKLDELETILEDHDLERMLNLERADREGRCVVLLCKPGREVWIVERDEDGDPECITGYVFLAQVKDYVIVAGFLNGSGDVDEILGDQAGQTLIEYNGDLPVFPACDCYLDKESALKAMKEREKSETD